MKTRIPKRIQYRGTSRKGRPVESMTIAGIGRTQVSAPTEILEGQVQGLKASAAEERAARALGVHQNVGGFQFRLAVGGARNTPGWKELDYLVWTKAQQFFAFEVDSAFTHRNKQNADVLHDAIILKELEYLQPYPQVIHLDGERDLVDMKSATQTFRRYF